MNYNIKRVLCGICAAVAVFACRKPETVVPTPSPGGEMDKPKSDPVLVFKAEPLIVSAEGGVYTYQFSTNRRPSVESSASWVSVLCSSHVKGKSEAVASDIDEYDLVLTIEVR